MTSRLYCPDSFVFLARAKKVASEMVAKYYGDLIFCAAVEMKFRAKGHGILTSTAVCLWWYKARRQNETSNQSELIGHMPLIHIVGILFLTLC